MCEAQCGCFQASCLMECLPRAPGWRCFVRVHALFTPHTPFHGWDNAAALLKPSLMDSSLMGKHSDLCGVCGVCP